MDRVQFQKWLNKLIELYGDKIEGIVLTGSRGFGYAREDSDWDVVIFLTKDCYTEDINQKNKIEQRITFHEDLANESIELFFSRPTKTGRTLRRWDIPPDSDDLPEWARKYRDYEYDMEEDIQDYFWSCAKNGILPGDFSRLHRSIPKAPVIYEQGKGITLNSLGG